MADLTVEDITTTTSLLDPVISEEILELSTKASALLSVANAGGNLTSGQTVNVFPSAGISNAAFTEVFEEKPAGNPVVGKRMVLKTVAEYFPYEKRAYNAAPEAALQRAASTFAKGFAKAFDTAVLTGVGAPAGFENFATSPTVDLVNFASIDSAIAQATATGNAVQAIVLTASAWAQLIEGTTTGASSLLDPTAGTPESLRGYPLYISPAAGIFGAVITEGAFHADFAATDIEIFRSGSVPGFNLITQNGVIIRTEADSGCVVFDPTAVVRLVEEVEEEDEVPAG